MIPLLSTLLVLATSVFIIWRLGTWLMVQVIRRLTGIDVTIQNVGIFSLSNVCIARDHSVSITLEVEKLWLSSSYLNKNTKGVIGLCLSGIRLQIDLPSSPSSKDSHASGLKHDKLIEKYLRYISYITNWLSVQADGVCCTVRGGQLNHCIVHITLDGLQPELTVQQDKINLFWIIQGCTTKLLSTVAKLEPHAPCVAQITFSHLFHVVATINDEKLISLQEFSTELIKPQISIQKALFDDLPLMIRWHHSAVGGTQVDIHPSQSMKFTFPQRTEIQISDLEVKLSEEEIYREVELSMKLLQLSSSLSIQDACICGKADVHIKELSARSNAINICNLHRLQTSLMGSDTGIDVSIQMLNSFVGYHHNELLHWLDVLQPGERLTRVNQPLPAQSASLMRSNKRLQLMNWLGQHPVKMNITLKHVSAAVAVIDCSGIKIGLGEARLSWILATRQGGWWDYKLDLELTSSYIKLAEGGIPSAELSPRKHHHNTLLYIGLFVVKNNRTKSSVCCDMIVDNLQLELSTQGLRVMHTLVSNIQPPHNEAYSSVGDTSNVTDVPYSGSKQTNISPDTLQFSSQCTNVTVFITYEDKVCTILRVDELMFTQKQNQMVFSTKLVKAAYCDPVNKVFNISRATDMHDSIGQVRQVNVTVNPKTETFELSVSEELFLSWRMALHLNVLEVVRELVTLKSVVKNRSKTGRLREPSSWAVTVQLPCATHIELLLQKQHKISLKSPEFVFRRDIYRTSLYIDQLIISCDDHEIFTLLGIHVSNNGDEELRVERQSFKQLELSRNCTWIVSFVKFKVRFPYGYDFAACLAEVKNLNKWRKLVHGLVKRPFTAESALPPDLLIKVKSVHIQIDDDPFEVKLGDNYKLICDEYFEHKKRVQTLDLRIQDLRKKHGLLPASKVEELYTSLELSRGDHYIRRSQCMYGSSPPRSALWYWIIDHLEITILCDTTIHGSENVIKNMREIDADSPYPDHGLEFVTLWCRMINLSCESFVIGFRDYPLPMTRIETLHVWGRLIGAEQKGDVNARRLCEIDQGLPWGKVMVERNMPSLKFYHDFSCDVNVFDMAYGGCWEPAMAQFNLCMNLINQRSADPSRPLPIWDKLRLLLHGRLTMSVEKMSWIYHASLDPYNKTEMMDWAWTGLVIDWTNAKWILQGDLDIYARTASKYDDCRLLHLPNLRFSIKLQWLTVGDPFDHHSVMPCAPEKQTVQDQDSFALFRSQGLNMSVGFMTKPKESDKPCCLFYASTLRWMDKIRMCMARVSRPIKRGPLFNYTVPRKPQFTRHVKDLSFSVALHEFEIDYWASFARQTGVKATGGKLSTDIGLQLTLHPIEDGLAHRPKSDWNIQQFKAEVLNFTVWLIRAKQERTQNKHKVTLCGPVSKSYLISVDRVSYQRAEPENSRGVKENADKSTCEADLAVHCLQVHSLRGAWTPSNRDVALDMYDAYVKAQRTKKNLSSEALHGFKVDNIQASHNMNRSLNTSGAKTLCLLSSPSQTCKQNDLGLSMLEKLVSESGTKFVAASEEMPEPELLVRQLHGITVCDTDDVVRKNWHVELYNSQVVLRGVETSGYMIVSAAKASLLACEHKPVWQHQQLKSKSTLVGSVESMQYYATVKSEDDILWLGEENISEQKETDITSSLEGMIGLADMVGSGHSVGGVVSSDMSIYGTTSPSSVQLQRIVSRCRCEFFYADYGEVEDRTLSEVPEPPSDSESDMLKHTEGVDCFTLLHHELNVCTNSLQYDMILDIVNNLMLYVEPKKKELTEKLENMRFSLQLGSIEDQRTPILQRQNTLRELLLEIRHIERQLYNIQRLSDDQGHSEELLVRSQELQKQLEICKDQVNALSEELAIMVSCFKESQLQVKTHHKMAAAHREAPVLRQYEVCFKHAEWRMTEDDGQIGIADLVLKNFLYKKTNCEDNSGAHQLDLGWVKVTNLLPGTPYREVLVPCDPQGKLLSERLPCLRILCRFKAPVGGISVKEHFEVNVAPLTIQLTARFYRTVMAYFFREKPDDTEYDDPEEIPSGLMENHPTQSGSLRGRKKDAKQDSDLHKTKQNTVNPVGDIDKMKERAAKNNMFLYIKIPEVPLKISYKGDKEKNITNIHDFQFLLPTLEYHDQTWTWHDLTLVLKNDCKKRLIAQAVQQKLHLKLHLFDCGEEDVQEDSDKARLLMGSKLLGPPEKTSKKSFFGIRKS